MNYSDIASQGKDCASADEEVAPDAVQLVHIATFNGLARVIAALAQNGTISHLQIDNIHQCMTAPLDDPDWRDDPTVTVTREVLEQVLAQALSDLRARAFDN